MNDYKAPRGYALVSEDLLRAWGKLDELREICVYPFPAEFKPSKQEQLEDFKHWLNSRRGLYVSFAFHDIVSKFEEIL